MRPFSSPRSLNLRPALAASMAATLAISGTAAVSIPAPTALVAQAAEATGELNAQTRADKASALPAYEDGKHIGVEGYSESVLPWFLSYQPTYANYYTASPGEDFSIAAPEYWEFYPEAVRRTPPKEITYEKGAPSDDARVNPDWASVNTDGSVEGTVPAGTAPGAYTLLVKATAPKRGSFTTDITLYVGEKDALSYDQLPDYVRYQPKFPRHPLVLQPGETEEIDGVAWSDLIRYGDTEEVDANDPNFDPSNPAHVDSHWPQMTDANGDPLTETLQIEGKKRAVPVNARAKFDTQFANDENKANRFCDASASDSACADGDPQIRIEYNPYEFPVNKDPEAEKQYRIFSDIHITAGNKPLGYVELPITFNYSEDESRRSWDTINLPLYIGTVDNAGQYKPVLDGAAIVGLHDSETADIPRFIDAIDPKLSEVDAPEGTQFFIPSVQGDVNYREWVSIENVDGTPVIHLEPGANEALLGSESHRTHSVPVQAQFADGTTSPAVYLPVTVYREKTVYPGRGPQPAGVAVEEVIEGKTEVTAKDAAGNDVVARFNADGEVELAPTDKATGPISVTIHDPNLGTVTKKVTLGTTTTVVASGATVYPDRGEQSARIRIHNIHDGLTKVTAKDAAGKPVSLTLDDAGKVQLNPTAEAQGPITVTVTDPSIGTVTKDVALGTTTLVSDPTATVFPDRGAQATGITVKEFHDGLTKVTAKDAAGKPVSLTLDDAGKVQLNPTAEAQGPITVTVTDPSIGTVTKDVTLGTTAAVTGTPSALNPSEDSQPTGLRITGGKQPQLSATWADKDGNTGTIPANALKIDADGNISVAPGNDAKGTVTLTISDDSLSEARSYALPVNTLADLNAPVARKGHSVTVGNALDARLARFLITNLGELPSGTTADFAKDEDDQAPQANVPGDKDVTIVVTYPDGSRDHVSTTLVVTPRPLNEVREPVTRPLTLTVGDELEASDAIDNPEELQAQIEFVDNDETPDTHTAGTYYPSIKVTYKDGTTDVVKTTVKVQEPPADNSLYRPKYSSPQTVNHDTQASTNQPFGGAAPDTLTATVLKTPADAVGWTFDIDSDGVITATAPSLEEMSQHYARLTAATDVDWETIETVLHSMAQPEVFVDFVYEDGTVDTESVVFELNAQDDRPILDPDGDADGDTHATRKEVEHRSNPFDPEVVPEAPARWDARYANEVYAGEFVTVPNVGGIPDPGAVVVVEGPATAEMTESGDLRITAEKDAEPGTPITVTVLDGEARYLGAVRVTVKKDLRTPAQKRTPSFGADTVPVKPSKKATSPRPYGTDAMPEDTEVLGVFPDDAPGWEFSVDEDARVHAQAPSIRGLSKHFAELANTDTRDWDTMVAALRPVIAPEASVRFSYPDGSSYFADVTFEMIDQSGASVTSPDGDADGDGITNADEISNGSNPFLQDAASPNWDFTVDDGPLTPGDSVRLPNRGGFVPEDLIVDVDGPGEARIDDGGNLIIVVQEQAIPGDLIVTKVKDSAGGVIDTVTIEVAAKDTQTPPAKIDTGKCIATGVGFGLPLLALIPLGIATQTAIPGLSDIAEQVSRQLELANTQLQQQLGILNPALAEQAAALNAQLRQARMNLASLAAGVALIAAGVTAAVVIYDACTPGELGSST